MKRRVRLGWRSSFAVGTRALSTETIPLSPDLTVHGGIKEKVKHEGLATDRSHQAVALERVPAATHPEPSDVQYDWVCSSCGFTNFSRRTTCFKCNGARQPDSKKVAQEQRFSKGRDTEEFQARGAFSFTDLLDARAKRDFKSMKALVRRYCKEGPVLTSKQHTLMLASMRAARVPWGDFTAQMERIRKDCGAVDPRHYSILFSALKDNSGIAHERALGLFDEMVRVDGVKPTVFSYAGLISALGMYYKAPGVDAGNEFYWRKAYGAFVAAPEECKQDYLYTAILRVLGNAGQGALAYSVFLSLDPEKRYEMNICRVMMSALCNYGQHELAKEVYAKAALHASQQQRGEEPNEAERNKAKKVYARALLGTDDWRKAYDVYQEIGDLVFEDHNMLGTMVDCLARHDRFAEVDAIVDAVLRRGGSSANGTNRTYDADVQANLRTLARIVDELRRSGRHQHVVDVYKRGTAANWAFHQDMYHAALASCCALGVDNEGYDLFAALPERLRRSPVVVTRTVDVLGEAGGWKACLHVLSDVVNGPKGSPPPPKDLAPSVVRACGQSNEWLMAYNTFMDTVAGASGGSPDLYLATLEVLGEAMESDDAAREPFYRVFNEGIDRRVLPFLSRRKRSSAAHPTVNLQKYPNDRRIADALVNYLVYDDMYYKAPVRERENALRPRANRKVLVRLPREEAGQVFRDLLEEKKDIVGVQNGTLGRKRTFAEDGEVLVVPSNRLILYWKTH